MASYICNDRAEAFVGPQAEIEPRFSEVPCERDKRAFELAAQGMTQRKIAQELHTSQSSVHRGIKKYRLWFGMTLPEDRGELVGFARFRTAVEERKIFLRHQMELAMEEWQQSRQGVPLTRKRTKIYPEGRKSGGKEVREVQIDEYVQKRHASAAHFNAAAKRSEELTMLEAGYLGVRQLSCDLAIDVDARDRWDRAVKSRDAKIEELTRKVAELEAELVAKNSIPERLPPLPLGEGRGEGLLPQSSPANPHPHPLPEGEGTPVGPSVNRPSDESRTAEMAPLVNQTSPAPEVASPIQKAPSGDASDSRPPAIAKAESDESRAKSGLPDAIPPRKSWRSMDPELGVLLMQINRLNNRH